MVQPIARPCVPGRYIVKGMAFDEYGRSVGRVAHAIVKADSALAAAALPIVGELRDRLALGMPKGGGYVEINVCGFIGEGWEDENEIR